MSKSSKPVHPLTARRERALAAAGGAPAGPGLELLHAPDRGRLVVPGRGPLPPALPPLPPDAVEIPAAYTGELKGRATSIERAMQDMQTLRMLVAAAQEALSHRIAEIMPGVSGDTHSLGFMPDGRLYVQPLSPEEREATAHADQALAAEESESTEGDGGADADHEAEEAVAAHA